MSILALRFFFLLKKDTTAGFGSYEAVGTPFQAMTILSFNVFWLDRVPQLRSSTEYYMLKHFFQLSCYQVSQKLPQKRSEKNIVINKPSSGNARTIVARLGKASILSDFSYEIYRYYEIFGAGRTI